jgi:hypothetical protein
MFVGSSEFAQHFEFLQLDVTQDRSQLVDQFFLGLQTLRAHLLAIWTLVVGLCLLAQRAHLGPHLLVLLLHELLDLDFLACVQVEQDGYFVEIAGTVGPARLFFGGQGDDAGQTQNTDT